MGFFSWHTEYLEPYYTDILKPCVNFLQIKLTPNLFHAPGCKTHRTCPLVLGQPWAGVSLCYCWCSQVAMRPCPRGWRSLLDDRSRVAPWEIQTMPNFTANKTCAVEHFYSNAPTSPNETTVSEKGLLLMEKRSRIQLFCCYCCQINPAMNSNGESFPWKWRKSMVSYWPSR